MLSILFLNQTCSRDNEVRVEDTHDGFSTTLNGCYPWKSPGYDVTTANTSAVVVIHLRSLIDSYRLKIHVAAVVVSQTAGFLTRYVSPVLGYIQTLGWHPFTKPLSAGKIIKGTASVKVPSDHATLISVVFVYLISEIWDYQCVELTMIDKRSKNPTTAWRTWSLVDDRPMIVSLEDAVEIRLNFADVRTGFSVGIRVLFSFHQFQPPSHSNNYNYYKWLCSLWPHVRLHIVCQKIWQCLDKVDEDWCPDTTCQEGDTQLDDSCYFFRYLQRGKTWQHAYASCKQKGASLASFSTTNSWHHLSLITQTEPLSMHISLGLQSTSASLPHMYRFVLQWVDGPIAHNYYIMSAHSAPFCTYFQANMLTQTICNRNIGRESLALCKVTLSPETKDSTEKHPHAKAKPPVLLRNDDEVRAKLRINAKWSRLALRCVVCPVHHKTHDFLAWDAFTACWSDSDTQHGEGDRNDNSTVRSVSASSSMTSPFRALFSCKTGAILVPYNLVCNHLRDCVDDSDEDFCVFPPCTASWQYMCANGQCVEFRQLCDQHVQCVDESDEADCTSDPDRGSYVYQPQPPLLGDFDGRGFLVYSPLRIKEQGDKDSAILCLDTHLLCPGDGYCLPVYIRCNAVYDCPGQEDEVGCDSYTCPGFYRCRGLRNTCLHPDHLCDGWPQCPENDDELFCNLTCPSNCACLGHAFTCITDFPVEMFSRLRYLDAEGTGLKPERLINNSMLIYLSLKQCSLTHLGTVHLPNLLRFDLGDNMISAVTLPELSCLTNLQSLSLARNPISELFSASVASNFSANDAILHIDVSGVELTELDVKRHIPFPGLRSLNLSQSGSTRVVGDGFRSLTSLESLDLRGCPMREFHRDVFEGLKDLRSVLADNYKLCCPANLPDGFSVSGCQAPFSEVSSCDALLRSDVYRVCLAVLAALALSGNLGCFCLRVLSLTGGGKTGFNVFVTHLCVSDFVMGVYLVMIGAADRMYLGRYLWEDSSWRRSAACQVAGVLALLSSEVSALIICLITLDRFLVIRFPFSGLRFSPLTAQVASLMTWAGGLALVTVPLLPMTLSWMFYGQTGICVPLPISGNDVARDRYAFAVMILLNMGIFLLIAFGQVSVYTSMTRNAMSSMDTTRKSRDLTVARRLITVVASDFFCWFPLGLLGVLAAQGVPIPSEVNVVMAIFVLPLNSALNPFLYTLNLIQEKRRRAKEAKLLKAITDGRIDVAVERENKE